MAIRSNVLAALVAVGVTAETPDADLKKEYFKAAGVPLNKNNVESVRKALAGDTTQVLAEGAAAPAKPKAEKAPKAPKEPKAPREVKPAETGEQALARLKASPDEKIAKRWARVTEVLEMGKKGPVRVRILCDDKGPEGQDLFRDIKVQDLFQVRYSADFAKKNARKNRKKSAASTETAAAPAATA